MPPAFASPFASAFCAAAFTWSASCPPSGAACSSIASSSYSSYFFAQLLQVLVRPVEDRELGVLRVLPRRRRQQRLRGGHGASSHNKCKCTGQDQAVPRGAQCRAPPSQQT